MLVGADAQTYYLSITTPTRGSSYTRGVDNVEINWGYGYYGGACALSVSLEVSSDGGSTWTTIASDLHREDESYTWDIPTTQTPGTSYHIKVSAVGLGDGYYYCIEDYESATSGAFTISKLCSAPTISRNPLPATVCTNTSHTFTVDGNMEEGTYQWKKNGNVVATTTTPSYTISSVATSHAGAYTVKLIAACNTTYTATSSSATLTVKVSPAITQQPQPSVSICQSGRATLTARATGSGKTFQWRKDGVNIHNAIDSNYIVDNAQLTSQGSYTVRVSVTCTTAVVSNASVVGVVAPPVITTQPTNLAICPGSAGQISVVATGERLSYQWFRDGVAIGATGSTLQFTNYNVAQDGQYGVVIRTNVSNPNACLAIAQSRTVTVTGYRPPSIVAQPSAVEGCIGKSVRIISKFDGSGLSYNWTHNGRPIPSSTTPTLSLINLSTADAGDYSVTATDVCNLSTSSNTVRVTVVKTPTFAKQPQSKDLYIGEPLTLSVDISEASSILWFKDGKLIAGQTGKTLTIPKVTLLDAGYYNATDSNACAGITSEFARITVSDPTALLPRLTMTTNVSDLGEIPLGYDATRTFTNLIQNTGTAAMQVTDISIRTSGGFAIANATATPFTLAQGTSSTVTVRATAENLTAMTGVLTVTTNAPLPTGRLMLTATPVLRYSVPIVVNYGPVVVLRTKDSCIQIANISATTITLEQATISGPNAGLFSVVTPLPITINANSTGEICVKFAPTTVGPNFTAQLNLTSSTGGNMIWTC